MLWAKRDEDQVLVTVLHGDLSGRPEAECPWRWETSAGCSTRGGGLSKVCCAPGVVLVALHKIQGAEERIHRKVPSPPALLLGSLSQRQPVIDVSDVSFPKCSLPV